MVYPATSPTYPLAIPIRGQNSVDALAVMDPSFSPYTLNFEPEPQYLRVRNGWNVHCTIPDSFKAYRLLIHSEKLLAYCVKTGSDSRIYDITTSTPSLVHTRTGFGAVAPISTFEYAGRAAFVGTLADSSVYTDNGTSFSALGFTVGAAAIQPRVGCSYKGRVYLGSTPSTVYYSALAGVTGACTLWDLSTIFRKTGYVNVLASLSPPTNKLDDQMLVVGLDAGEVLIYAGDNPGATNWQLVAHFDVPELRGYSPFLSFNNDIWLITKVGVISIRSLFEHNASAMDKISPTYYANPDISALQGAVSIHDSGFHTALAFWPERNLVYLMMRRYLVSGVATSGISFWVYNILSKGLTFCRNIYAENYASLTCFNNALYFPSTTSLVYKMSPSTTYQDYNEEEGVGYPNNFFWKLYSAYSDLGGLGYKRVAGIGPLINTNLTGSAVTAGLASDFGRKVTSLSTVPLLAAGGYQSPFYSVGVEGFYVQYRLEGTTSAETTTGFSLYSVGLVKA